MEPKATMPMTPRTTTIVPCVIGNVIQGSAGDHEGGDTYVDICAGYWCAYEETRKQEIEDEGCRAKGSDVF